MKKPKGRKAVGVVLPCPECLAAGVKGAARIGNRRTDCRTCNRWAQSVLRGVRARMKALHEEEYKRLFLEVERDLYPQIIENFTAEYPELASILSD